MMKRLHHSEKELIKEKILSIYERGNKEKVLDLLQFYILKLLNIYLEEVKEKGLEGRDLLLFEKLREIRNKIAHNECISREEITFVIKNMKFI